MANLRNVVLSIILCLLSTGTALGKVYPKFTEKLSAFALRVRTDDLSDTKNLALVVALLARETDRLLHFSEPAQKALTIHLLRQEEQEPSDAANLYLSRQDSPVVIFYTLSKTLLLRRIRESLERDNLSLPSVDCLAAALCNRVFYDGLGVRTFYKSDYRIARGQFLDGYFPQIELLLNQPMPPEDSPLFRLYLLHCDLLVQAIENSKLSPGIFYRKLFEMEAYGRKSHDAFEFLLKPEWQSHDNSLQSWYARNVLLESGKGWQRAESEDVIAQLQELITVPVLQAGQGNALTRVPLDQMPKLLEDYKVNALALTLLQNKILKLRIAAPPLLQEPIMLYSEALQLLKGDKTRRFKKKFQEAQQAFAAAVERQQKITTLLEKTEKERSQTLQDFTLFLQIEDKYEKIRRELLP